MTRSPPSRGDAGGTLIRFVLIVTRITSPDRNGRGFDDSLSKAKLRLPSRASHVRWAGGLPATFADRAHSRGRERRREKRRSRPAVATRSRHRLSRVARGLVPEVRRDRRELRDDLDEGREAAHEELAVALGLPAVVVDYLA